MHICNISSTIYFSGHKLQSGGVQSRGGQAVRQQPGGGEEEQAEGPQGLSHAPFQYAPVPECYLCDRLMTLFPYFFVVSYLFVCVSLQLNRIKYECGCGSVSPNAYGFVSTTIVRQIKKFSVIILLINF